jgi:hypothetical protein
VSRNLSPGQITNSVVGLCRFDILWVGGLLKAKYGGAPNFDQDAGPLTKVLGYLITRPWIIHWKDVNIPKLAIKAPYALIRLHRQICLVITMYQSRCIATVSIFISVSSPEKALGL